MMSNDLKRIGYRPPTSEDVFNLNDKVVSDYLE